MEDHPVRTCLIEYRVIIGTRERKIRRSDIVGFIVYMIRIVLVALALRYVWRAVKRAIQGEQAPRPPETSSRKQSVFSDIRNVEDIDYEDID